MTRQPKASARAKRPVSTEPVFSEFVACKPQSGGRYRVAVRGSKPGDTFCACADFTTNDFGPCKHIEFTLARLAAKRGGKAAFARGFEAPWRALSGLLAGRRRS